MPRRRHESLGDMISTMVFLGVSLTLTVASIDTFLIGDYLRGFGFSFAAVLCFLGGLRYPIARFADRIGWPKK